MGGFDIINTIFASHTIGIAAGEGVRVTEDYNLFFGNGTNTVGVTSGGHSLTGDSAFADPWADDYHLTALSAAIDAGTDLGVTNDFEGDTRPEGAAPDIGADESPFEAPSAPTPTATSTATATSMATATATGTATRTPMVEATGTATPPGQRQLFLPVIVRGDQFLSVVVAARLRDRDAGAVALPVGVVIAARIVEPGPRDHAV